jgi:tRNA(adenine34) deaminase
MELFSHEYFMKTALKLAQEAYEDGEVPVGAIIVAGNKIIAKAYNQTERLKDPTAHAEMLAITSATNYLGSKYLHDCRLYVTLEPCVMCAGALYWTQLSGLIYGASDPDRGFSRVKSDLIHPKTEIVHGIAELECSEIVTTFFSRIRKRP